MRETIDILRIPSDPQQISRIEDYIHQITEDTGIDRAQYGNVLVSLTEAINNAIIHGNRCDCSKHVEIQYERSLTELAITIKDQGKGFNFDQLPDPTQDENLLKIGGRGVFMMKMLSDEIQFDEGGSKVTLCFKL